MNKDSGAADKIESPRREPRLPPGQVKTEKWPVLHYGSVPRADLGTWELRVDGLVEQPQRWGWEGRPRREPRPPPGQVKTEKWPVLHYGSVPRADLGTWELRVDGLVEQPQRWSWEEFQKLPRVQVVSDIHCVTRWSRYDNLWEGVEIGRAH